MRRIVSFLLMLVSVAFAQADDKRVFRILTAADGLADNSAQTIKCTKTGRMTITTLGNINFYDGAQFSYISSKNEDRYRLENYQGNYRLNYDNSHRLWLKNTNSVTCVNLTTEEFINNMDSLFASMGMKEKVYDLFVDSEGDVWLRGQKFLRNVRLNQQITLDDTYQLQDLEVYKGKELFLFHGDGLLVCYDLKTGNKRYQNRAYEGERIQKYNRSSVILLDDKGFYQIRNGEEGAILMYYQAKSRQWSIVMETEDRLNGMAFHDGELFIASSKGYYVYSPHTGNIVHEEQLRLVYGRELETDVTAIEFDRQGGMWVGTEKRGLLYARPLNAPFTILALDHPDAVRYMDMMADLQGIDEFNGRSANVMYIDSRRWTWVGTASGLYLYTSPQAEPELLTRNSGLLNNVVHTIVEDKQHNVWVGSSYGITCLQVVDNKIKYVTSFNNDDNVPNETFVDGKTMLLDDGSIVMQTIAHVIVFNPADFNSILSQQPILMYPKLTSMLVNGTFVTVGTEINGMVILDKAITRTKEINLNYDMNTISLTFSAMNFARPLQTFYRVRIREIDNEWKTYSFYNSGGLVDRRGLLHMPLVALKPGTYHIELQASNVIDKFEGEPYEWIVNVNEPWWRASGMLLGLIGVLMALLIVNFILYNRNTRLRERRNSDEGDMVRRIQNYVERCQLYEQELLGEYRDDSESSEGSVDKELDKEFVNIMVVVLPYVKEQGSSKFSIRELVDLTGTDVATFYKIVTANLYKNPRSLVRVIRLTQVQEMLRNTSKSIEEISEDCYFASPNSLISSFYHEFRMTPRDYRLTT